MNIGIYKITNLINNKFYIGSSVCLNRRKENHFYQLNKNIHNNKHLQSSFNKYTKKNFKFEIIEYCNKEDVLIREQHYLDTFKPHYNFCKIAGNTLGIKCSEETKRKISNSNRGKIRTEETINKLKNSWNGKYNHAKTIYLLDSNYKLINSWKSAGDAEKDTNIKKHCFNKAAFNNRIIISKKSKLNGFIVTYNKELIKE